MDEHNKVNRARPAKPGTSRQPGRTHPGCAPGQDGAWASSSSATADPCLGIIMLDTRFPRPVGDVGNSNSHHFPMIAERVPGAYATEIVGLRSEQEIKSRAQAFMAAGRRLVARGAQVVGTSCGFLTPLQAVMAQELPVPVALSALLQVPLLETVLGRGRVGILTFDAATLSPAHLAAAGVRDETPMLGLPKRSTLRAAILTGAPLIDQEAATDELVFIGKQLVRRNPQLRALVLECTNMPPYRSALRRATGLPVYDVNTLLDLTLQGMRG